MFPTLANFGNSSTLVASLASWLKMLMFLALSCRWKKKKKGGEFPPISPKFTFSKISYLWL